MITDSFVKQFKGKQPKWGFGDLSYIVYKRSYARPVEDRTEEYWESLRREINGAQDIGADYTKDEAERLFKYMWNMKCSFAGRMKWQLGTDTVKTLGMASLLNCWFVNFDDSKAFEFLFDMLMLGGGVGGSVKRELVYELPKVKAGVKVIANVDKDADFIVPDSREGWVRLLKKILKSFFITGESFSYSTILIRGAGERLKKFGGISSGSKILVEGVEDICKIFQNRENKKLRSIDVLDIANITGKIVVSGNVRRSAEILIGDVDDYLFLQAKRWDKGIPNWRAMSNNSIYCNDIEHLPPLFWEGYHGNGEPYGLININLAKKVGRLKDKMKDDVDGANPCAEILLKSYECCNLSEIFLNNIESEEELIDIAKLLYKTQKAICNGKYHWKETEELVHKNNRIGISNTGICQSEDKIKWLDKVYTELRKFDKKYSKEKGWNESIRLTTIKPSGTLSLLAGATAGVHPAYSEYYYRTMRMASNDPLVEYCREAGYRVEYQKNFDDSFDYNTVVIYFPIHMKNCKYAKDMTAIDQLELVKLMQTEWADNSISVTVYYRKEELDSIKQWLKDNYKDTLKTVSFLLHSEHGFSQAVYQEISGEEYDEAVKKIKKIEFMGDDTELDKGFVSDCEDGSCGINDILIT